MTNVTYVTALYKIYDNNYNNILSNNVKDLLQSGLKLIIYVDEYFHGIIKDIISSDNIKIILLPRRDLHIFNMIVANKKYIKCPTDGNPTKNTHEYAALQNSKIEFLYRSCSLIDTEYIAWIDAGVTKLFKNKSECLDRLLNLKIKNVKSVLIPGCYERANISMEDLCSRVFWVFAGTFFIVNSDYVETFYSLTLQSLARFFLAGYTVWEVNSWIDIQKYHPEVFVWYKADHNDLLTIIPIQYRN